MPAQRDLKLKKSQLVWLVAIIAVGVVVGVTAGAVWGLVAAGVTLAVSEITERVTRARRT